MSAVEIGPQQVVGESGVVYDNVRVPDGGVVGELRDQLVITPEHPVTPQGE